MLYTFPDYFDKFYCLKNECPKSCCEGWQIQIDENALKRYIDLKGPFGNRVRNSIDFKQGVFLQYNKRCAFLNEDNLCDMHIEAGENMMCDTCKMYPKHIEEFENEREFSLSLSCPFVAKMILENEKKVEFIIKEDDKEEEDFEFDFFLYSALQESRKFIFEVLQNTKEDIYIRINKIIYISKGIQKLIDDDNIFEIENLIFYLKENDFKDIEYDDFFVNFNGEKIKKIFDILYEFEVLDDKWRIDRDRYSFCATKIGDFKEIFLDISKMEIQQLLVYYIYVYFTGSVYDYDVISKMGMCIYNVILWSIMCKVEFLEGEDKKEKRIELAWRLAREIEHSNVNLDKLECLVKEKEFL